MKTIIHWLLLQRQAARTIARYRRQMNDLRRTDPIAWRNYP